MGLGELEKKRLQEFQRAFIWHRTDQPQRKLEFKGAETTNKHVRS